MGRKPKNERPMSDAEKMREYRQRRKELGQRQISLSFSESKLEKIDELVEFFELPNRTSAIQDLLYLPLLEAMETVKAAKEESGYELLARIEDEEERKALHKIKNVLWKSITYRSEELGNSLVNELQKNLGTDDGR